MVPVSVTADALFAMTFWDGGILKKWLMSGELGILVPTTGSLLFDSEN
jgi:hypothetical protein